MFRSAILLLIFLGSLLVSPWCAAAAEKHVLVLNSYHQGYTWTDDQLRGIISGLKDPETKLYIEYMGAKWVSETQYFARLAQTLSVKYRHIPFDVIVATDNDALDFLREYRDEIFGPVPSVFSGVNYVKPDDLKPLTHFTGVNEAADINAGLDVIRRLHPATKHVFVVTDSSSSGRRVKEQFVDVMPSLAGKIEIEFGDDLRIEELLDRVASLPPDSVVFFAFYFRDSAGRMFGEPDVLPMIAKKARVPVYGAWSFNLGHGILGGKITSGFDQGEIAGKLAARILAGEPVKNIPVVMESPTRYMFDLNQLRRFGIRKSDLPAGSTVINEPPSFYAVNKSLVWAGVTGLAGLVVVVVLLVVNNQTRRRAGEALSESETKYRALTETSSAMIAVYRQKFLYVNPIAEQVLGYTRDELMQMDIWQIAHPEYREIIKERGLKRLRGEPVPSHYEIKIVTRSGEDRWLDCSLTVLQFDGQPAVLGVFVDITDRKRAEDQLSRAQEQLRQASKMEAVGRLAGGIAHDFNNQLTIVQGYGALLLSKLPEGDTSRELVGEIVKAAERSAKLTGQLLAFSRKQVLHPEYLDLGEVLSSLENALGRLIGEDIRIAINVAPDVWRIKADRNLLEQAIINLAINARDAMPHGGQLMIDGGNTVLDAEYVLRHMEAAAGPFVVLSVRDTGVGMDEETRQRIFEPFFTTKADSGGTGLGLAMVYGFVKQSGGHLEVFSELGRGTCFNLYFPGTELAAVRQESVAAKPACEGTETVLLVEDEDALRELMSHILMNCGYRVLKAPNGASAIEISVNYEKKIDLLLSDIIMPEMSGPEVVSRLKAHRPELKVVYVSGYADGRVSGQTIGNDGTHLLMKPFTPETLLTFIRGVLDGKPAIVPHD